MAKIKELTDYLEELVPHSLQESYDNAGLLTGDKEQKLTGVLITLDITEEVIQEAVDKGCNLIIAHHPVIFRGLKKLTGANNVERTVIRAIRENIALYAMHTNLDNVSFGVNKRIADRLGLINCEILLPKPGQLVKLVTYVPLPQKEPVQEALWAAGAGKVGNYDECSFYIKGFGTFRPNEHASPFIGVTGKQELVSELRLEVLLPVHRQQAVMKALKESHPYEEISYYLEPLYNEHQGIGAGLIGELPDPMEPFAFLDHLKDRMQLKTLRHTAPAHDLISRVALCGGSGSFLTARAIQRQAEAFVTADVKYHEFFDADKKVMIADIGHYESEVFTKELIYDIISKKFTKFALHLSNIVTNPISYR